MQTFAHMIIRDRRFQMLAVIVGAFALTGLAWWGYQSYRTSLNERAQVAFMQQVELFEKTRTAKETTPQAWRNFATDLGCAYQKHASSDLGPFFKTLQAQAFLEAGDREQAISTLAQAYNAMGKKSPLSYLYATKLALMRFDSEKTEVHEQGKQELQALADDRHNPHRGMAWYGLWHDAWVRNDQQAATAAYQQLVAFGQQGSHYAQLAQQKIAFKA